MDKTKIGSILALVGLSGFLAVVKSSDPPAPSEEDHDETSAQATPLPTADSALIGGITALKIEDLRIGTGPAAKIGDNLRMNYKGELLNGQVFDQSYGRTPFDFKLGTGDVIKGWDQGIKGMKAGGKRRLTIPASLGYGAMGSGKIPGSATLKFDVELLSVNGKK